MSVFDSPGIHKLTASWIYHCKPEEINKTDIVQTSMGVTVNRYFVGKQVRHAGERRIQPKGLVTKLLQGFTIREGEALLKAFHQNESQIQEVFHRDITAAVSCPRHELRAPNGRLRQFFDRIDHETVNKAISYLPQAIVSDQTKFEGILRTAATCPRAEFLSEQHDGVLAEIPKGLEREYCERYKEYVESPIDFRRCTLSREYDLSIPCEISMGENWYELEDFHL